MTINDIHALTNLSAHQYIELPIAEGQDVIATAQAFLRESDLPAEIQQGFYISVYPTGQAAEPAPRTTPFPVIADPDPQVTESQTSAVTDLSEAPTASDDALSHGYPADGSPAVDGPTDDVPADDDAADAANVGQQQSGSLAAAAAAGPLHWTDDSEDEPAESDRPLIIGIPVGGGDL